MPLYKIETRFSPIESCAVKINDFKTLYRKLSAQIEQAITIEIANARSRYDNLPEEQLNRFIEDIRNSFKLSVQIFGAKGEFLSGDDNSIFDDENFPERLNKISFDSSISFKQRTGLEPINKIYVLFDFSKKTLFDFTFPIQKTSPPKSSRQIYGSDETWVRGVNDTIKDFVKDNKKRRGWLHAELTHILYIYAISIPASFWIVYKISEYLKGKVPSVLSIGIYIYIFFMILIMFRIMHNYAKWIYPLYEFVPESGTKMGKHKRALYFIFFIFIPALLTIINLIF